MSADSREIDFYQGVLLAIARAWEDERFRALLLKDAHAALGSIGCNMPENVQLRFVEAGSDSTSITLVLPPKPADMNDGAVALAQWGADRPIKQIFC
ncbi:nitrile hydratase subunit alpha [Polyangium sp. 6x1]|uniref:nitrile hydratase subunit alpha n=1 Tax=Polyangium sp. 6x1 TaxID=3042689 RepID=UPI002482E891|nr:nitrile hydratase subunit alpha [Polyangium sp. 6x1]MDI1449282.1 nitrile hydratase subunit alpha [Polyangium sp. 6x1]